MIVKKYYLQCDKCGISFCHDGWNITFNSNIKLIRKLAKGRDWVFNVTFEDQHYSDLCMRCRYGANSTI